MYLVLEAYPPRQSNVDHTALETTTVCQQHSSDQGSTQGHAVL